MIIDNEVVAPPLPQPLRALPVEEILAHPWCESRGRWRCSKRLKPAADETAIAKLNARTLCGGGAVSPIAAIFKEDRGHNLQSFTAIGGDLFIMCVVCGSSARFKSDNLVQTCPGKASEWAGQSGATHEGGRPTPKSPRAALCQKGPVEV